MRALHAVALVPGGLLAVALIGAIGAGSPGAAASIAAPAPVVLEVRTSEPEELTVVEAATPEARAVAVSAALYASADVAVLSTAGTADRAAAIATRLDAPLLLVPGSDGDDGDAPGLMRIASPAVATTGVLRTDAEAPSAPPIDSDPLRAELARLGATTLVTVGATASRWAETASGATVVDESALGSLPPVDAGTPLDDDVLLVDRDEPATRATAESAGATVLTVPSGDPRTDDDAIAALAAAPPDRVLAVGAFGPPDLLAQRLATAETGVLLPGGGQILFPDHRFVALYGSPDVPALGLLGEQGPAEAVARARDLAARYEPLSDVPVTPAFELIATIADAWAGDDGDYSWERSVEELRPWVDAARDAGMYVVLDLQPGRTDFLTQAKRYEELLREPHVGLALDPEWRLLPHQFHLRQFGSAPAAEVNAVVDWLEDLVRANHLPQKALVLHQFVTWMLPDRPLIRTDSDLVRVVVHVDGSGAPASKLETWGIMQRDAPAGIEWGWKNFIDEDAPVMTPEETMSSVRPSPAFISYQ